MPHYEFFSDSARLDSDNLILEGAWLHDPEDPVETVRHYRFGRDARSSDIDVGGTNLVFAGRRFPVVEYGEHQTDNYSVRVDIPHGEGYQTRLESIRRFAELKRTVVFRDNRGRIMFGTMSGYSESDESVGSGVGFVINRVSREVTTL